MGGLCFFPCDFSGGYDKINMSRGVPVMGFNTHVHRVQRTLNSNAGWSVCEYIE